MEDDMNGSCPLLWLHLILQAKNRLHKRLTSKAQTPQSNSNTKKDKMKDSDAEAGSGSETFQSNSQTSVADSFMTAELLTENEISQNTRDISSSITRSRDEELTSWQQLIKKTNDALMESKKLRDDVSADIYDLKQMKVKVERIDKEKVSIAKRMKVTYNKWKHLDDIIRKAEEAGSNIKLLNIPEGRRVVDQFQKNDQQAKLLSIS